MYLEYKESGEDDAVSFLIKKLCNKDYHDTLILSARDALNLSGDSLVWWVGMVDNYHKHPDFSYNNLLRTRKHFKNIAFSYLDDGNYEMFSRWIKNWSDLLIVCRYAFPELWESKNSETIR
jgi:hypothetical protein